MSQDIVLSGSCFCTSLSYEVKGKPALSAYCHCTGCQRLTGCPFIHTVHFESNAFRWITPDAEAVSAVFVPSDKPWKSRWRCKSCGVGVASRNSKTGRWSIWAAQLSRDNDSGKIVGLKHVQATAHIFYDTRMLDVNDGLGKWDGYENKSTRIA